MIFLWLGVCDVVCDCVRDVFCGWVLCVMCDVFCDLVFVYVMGFVTGRDVWCVL